MVFICCDTLVICVVSGDWLLLPVNLKDGWSIPLISSLKGKKENVSVCEKPFGKMRFKY